MNIIVENFFQSFGSKNFVFFIEFYKKFGTDF